LTIHRDNNTDHPEHLKTIFTALLKVIEETDLDLVFPIHPRTKLKIEQSLDEETKAKFKSNAKFHFINPVGFLDMIALESKAKIVLTDSGGVQKEAYFFKKPCVIFRKETEWVEMVNNGNAILAGIDPQLIIEATQKLLNKTDFTYPDFFGDGKAAKFICEKIIENL
jgi:UDP-GlcNAc3NAcA epimerase